VNSDLAGGETLPSAVCHKSLSQHGANRKADRGITKLISEHFFKTTGKFVPVGSGICRDCRKSVFESSVSSVTGITSTDMEEGAGGRQEGGMCHALERFGVAFTHTAFVAC